MGWRRNVMEGALALFVLVSIIGLFVNNLQAHFPLLGLMFFGITLAYIFVARDFITQIKGTHCDCAQSQAFEVLNVVNWIQLFFVANVMLSVFLKIAFMVTVGRAPAQVGRASRR